MYKIRYELLHIYTEQADQQRIPLVFNKYTLPEEP